MPYFVYKIGHLGILEAAGVADRYQDAKARATELRRDAATPEAVRIVFAANELEAEELLSRPPRSGPAMLGEE